MVINPLVKDAMQRAGEEMPADGVLVMSTGNAIACTAGTPQADALKYANDLQQGDVYAWLDRYQKDFMDEKKSKACQKALASLKACITVLKNFPE